MIDTSSLFLYRHIFVAVAFSIVVFLWAAVAPGSSQKLMRISFIMRRKSGSTVKAVNTVTWKRLNKSKNKVTTVAITCGFPAKGEGGLPKHTQMVPLKCKTIYTKKV